jgi:hypothetical protein
MTDHQRRQQGNTRSQHDSDVDHGRNFAPRPAKRRISVCIRRKLASALVSDR